MRIYRSTYDYLLTPNNNIVVHYELCKQEESEDRLTPQRNDIIINKLKLVVEPSSSVVLAALIKNKSRFKNKNIGLIMCGGNIDFSNLKF